MKVLLNNKQVFLKNDRAHIFIDSIKASDVFQYLPKCSAAVSEFNNLVIYRFR